ncbi:cytoplasmic tRNA 2-thiolation protein 1-like [Diaphorina citri]|uniref:Cytoplasmic tRNA 2-thiolation protein 1-like n=1 Tax=Diaphorina citri TaxID=121845 RepID=A0A1S3DD06_DIACI|nr:cytoplasmic tRNA 2-thiolation protein 1-like [Diaphorina citri]
MPIQCSAKCGNLAVLKRPKTGDTLCKECFFHAFELEIHHTIVTNKLFEKHHRIAIAASGGKDSTVLAHVLKVLNEKYQYGLDLVLLSIDEDLGTGRLSRTYLHILRDLGQKLKSWGE